MTSSKHKWLLIAFLSVLYALLGPYSVTKIVHPHLTEGYIAFNMTIVVVAGILFGRFVGTMVGIAGPIIICLASSLILPTDSMVFDLLSIGPMGVMGYAAGAVCRKSHITLGLFSITIGHILNMASYTLAGVFPLSNYTRTFMHALGYEIILDILVINAVCTLALISFPGLRDQCPQ